ncbi:PREDICTED: zeaxanthin epoxidase, chloroplastic-like [Ipomoea nil]|uniref:zeaxanthin epoxidase, chloroplastic-like n=1 Tax=Ipomoea nil TaxID=35883 RepID=UPI0009016A22|nr:PREDICTED: zeaxanthin epoxidase, chloroplastic-like [Ipomoea nil]
MEFASAASEKHEIVIIGGGICGLATALAPHRKGLKSIVLERSETLRAYGGGIGLLPNAWRALDQLGVGSRLRSMAVLLQGDIGVGMLPITQHLIHWFVALPTHLLSGDKFPHDPKYIKQMTLELIKDFPSNIQEIIELSDLDSLSATHLRYRAPWDLVLGTMRKGTVTVAGDAMHVMGPFVGQGGASGLEDAVVLGRCLSMAMSGIEGNSKKEKIAKIEAGLDQYVKERRMRVLGLSTLTYLIGIIVGSTSPLVKMVAGFALAILFRDRAAHIHFDCGRL